MEDGLNPVELDEFYRRLGDQRIFIGLVGSHSIEDAC